MFEFNNKLLRVSFNNYFKSVRNVHSYHTRPSETSYFLPRFNNKNGHKYLAYQGIKLWTELPLSLENLSNVGKFQDELENSL